MTVFAPDFTVNLPPPVSMSATVPETPPLLPPLQFLLLLLHEVGPRHHDHRPRLEPVLAAGRLSKGQNAIATSQLGEGDHSGLCQVRRALAGPFAASPTPARR